MSQMRKSPQEKKNVEYGKDHFTFAWYSSKAFPKTWRRKKTLINREYRRKSDELLVRAKPEISADDAELVVGEVTAAHVEKSILRKRLSKGGTVTLAEKVKLKLQKREESSGRRKRLKQPHDDFATQAISTLQSLAGDALIDFVRQAHAVCRPGVPYGIGIDMHSTDPKHIAIRFLHLLAKGHGNERDALCRNEEKRCLFSIAAFASSSSRKSPTAHQMLLGIRYPSGPTGPLGPIFQLAAPSGLPESDNCSGVVTSPKQIQ